MSVPHDGSGVVKVELVGSVGAYDAAEAVDLSSEDWEPTAEFSAAAGVPGQTRAFLVETAGDLKVDMARFGTAVVLPVLVGYNPIAATKVYKVGTDADGITALG